MPSYDYSIVSHFNIPTVKCYLYKFNFVIILKWFYIIIFQNNPYKQKMDQIVVALEPLKKFSKDSIRYYLSPRILKYIGMVVHHGPRMVLGCFSPSLSLFNAEPLIR